MERIWLSEYPDGIPADIDSHAYSSLRDILVQSCTTFGDLPAYSNMGVSLTYRDINEKSRQFAAYLQTVAGLKKGDRLALMMPNLLQYPVALFAGLRAGLAIVNVNPMYTPRELEHQLSDAGVKAIVVLENFAHTVEEVLDTTPIETIITTRVGDLLGFPKGPLVNFVVSTVKKAVPAFDLPNAVRFGRVLSEGACQSAEDADLTHDDIAFLQYTGGTTGVAKGAVLTHGNMVSNLQQASAWLSPVTRSGQEIVITALPLYHVFSLTANCLTYMKLGGVNVLITNPRDCAGFVKTLKKTRFTGITGVNTLFNALLHTPGFADIDFSHMRVSLGGGMAVQRAVAEEWKSVTGHPLIEAYGLTETAPAACMNPMTNTAYNGSIGVPISSTYVSIRDNEGKELGINEIGEICIKGPQVMREYWNRPKETEAVFWDDRWFMTGDIGRMDERGYVYIEDRKKDMILVSGFNVYPNEVESVVVSHAGVLEAAAIGIPDPKSGEIVKLFVVKKDPGLTEQDLVAHCRENLSAYKVPKLVEFRDSLPKSTVGKILRRALRDSPPDAEA